MLARPPPSLYPPRRPVLFPPGPGAPAPGAFGVGAATPRGPSARAAPPTRSVQATNRFQAAAGRQIDAGVVALVGSGDVRGAAARAKVAAVQARLRAQPDVERVLTYYDTRNPSMVSRDGTSTYVLAYFRPRAD